MSEGSEVTSVGAEIKLRCAPEFKAEVEEAAGELQLNVSALTRLALADYLERRREKKILSKVEG